MEVPFHFLAASYLPATFRSAFENLAESWDFLHAGVVDPFWVLCDGFCMYNTVGVQSMVIELG